MRRGLVPAMGLVAPWAPHPPQCHPCRVLVAIPGHSLGTSAPTLGFGALRPRGVTSTWLPAAQIPGTGVDLGTRCCPRSLGARCPRAQVPSRPAHLPAIGRSFANPAPQVGAKRFGKKSGPKHC